MLIRNTPPVLLVLILATLCHAQRECCGNVNATVCLENDDDLEFYLPFPAGTGWYVTRNWCAGSHGNVTGTTASSNAYDFGIIQGGQILAPAPGTVTEVVSSNAENDCCCSITCSSQANLVELTHSDGSLTRYLHLKSVSVSLDDEVERGQLLGISGRTGWTCGDDGPDGVCGDHLHYERRLNGEPKATWFVETGHVEIAPWTVVTSQNELGVGDGSDDPDPTSEGFYWRAGFYAAGVLAVGAAGYGTQKRRSRKSSTKHGELKKVNDDSAPTSGTQEEVAHSPQNSIVATANTENPRKSSRSSRNSKSSKSSKSSTGSRGSKTSKGSSKGSKSSKSSKHSRGSKSGKKKSKSAKRESKASKF